MTDTDVRSLLGITADAIELLDQLVRVALFWGVHPAEREELHSKVLSLHDRLVELGNKVA